MEVRRGTLDNPLGTGWVDDKVVVGVIDVIGERLASPPINRWGLALGHFFVGEAEELGECSQLARWLGDELVTDAGQLRVGRKPSRGVPPRVYRNLDDLHL